MNPETLCVISIAGLKMMVWKKTLQFPLQENVLCGEGRGEIGVSEKLNRIIGQYCYDVSQSEGSAEEGETAEIYVV